MAMDFMDPMGRLGLIRPIRFAGPIGPIRNNNSLNTLEHPLAVEIAGLQRQLVVNSAKQYAVAVSPGPIEVELMRNLKGYPQWLTDRPAVWLRSNP